MNTNQDENGSVSSVFSVAKESVPSFGRLRTASVAGLACPIDKLRDLHDQVSACWARYQALGLELLALEGRVADCRQELTAAGKAIYELREATASAADPQ